jgi:glycosyltransferase involved in cell wall biosynthesis
MSDSRFHYLITIHNKEALLPRVLEGVARCAGRDSVVVPVLDGCTDNSSAIVESFARQSGLEVRPTVAPDVHEIRSINAGLAQCGPGFCLILQDDVVLRDPNLESRLRELRERHHRRLGLVSLRMGGDLVTESLRTWCARLWRSRGRLRARTLEVTHLVGSCFDSHPVPKVRTLNAGDFAATTAVFKSPVALAPELRELEPRLDEALAPYGYDDLDLSVRSVQRNLINGVFALDYTSDVDWGGTRKSAEFAAHSNRIMVRNRAYLWRKHRSFLRGAGRRWLLAQ